MSRKFGWQHNVNPDENPIMCHPVMEAQRYHTQLGQISIWYPNAVHKRFHHCGYTGHIAGKIYDVLADKGRHPGSKRDIIAGAQLHDGAHPPFSHGVEYLLEQETGIGHNKRIVQLLNSDIKDSDGRTMRKALLDFGADPDIVQHLLLDKPPISQVWSHPVLGADPLAYLEMDADMVGFWQDPPDWERMIPYYTFYQRGLGIEMNASPLALEDPLSMVCATQEFYLRMYTQVYHSARSISFQRHIQKAVELAMKAGALKAQDIWDLKDEVLLDRLENGYDAVDQQMMAKARETIRPYKDHRPFVPIGDFRYERFAKSGHIAIPERFGVGFVNAYKDPRKQTVLEGKLEKELGLPVLLAFFPDPKKLDPKNVDIYRKNELVGTLESECAEHIQGLKAKAKMQFYMHVLAPESEATRMHRPENQDRIKGAVIDLAQETVYAWWRKKEEELLSKETGAKASCPYDV